MHPILQARPEVLRLLKSATVALPVTRDMRAALAHGIGMRIEELDNLLRDLADAGIVTGMAGEPNPMHPAVRVATVLAGELNDNMIVRWRTGTTASAAFPSSGQDAPVLASAEPGGPRGAMPAVSPSDEPFKWFKIGLAFPVEGDALAPDSDRTLHATPVEAAPLPEADAAVAWALARPVGLGGDPGGALGERAGLGPEAARAAVQRLVVGRVWRRFALRVDLVAAGWAGCGVAHWRLGAEDLPQAGTALSTIVAAGDVWAEGGALRAVLVGAEAGAGEATARRISQKWGVELEGWEPLVATA